MIQQRIVALRELMRREHLSAFIFPSTDPHLGEYVPDHWKGREWISGFNGSAGTAVVTLTSAALWTDSRYFLAAEEQLKGTEYQLMRLKMDDTPTIAEWLKQELSRAESPEVGIDGMVTACADLEQLIADLRRAGGITVRTNLDPLRSIWKDRPAVPANPIVLHPLDFAGEETSSKLRRIRAALREQHADGMLVSSLDDIAWTLNLRGSDVHCNPVFVAYLLITTSQATLYVNRDKLTGDVELYLQAQHVATEDYEQIEQGLKAYFEYNILLDPAETSYTLFRAVTREVVRGQSPIPSLKAVKNAAEIAGFRQAMIRDGIAMVKFLKWLKPAVAAGGQTEMTIGARLTAFRAEQPLYKGLSFDTIVGYESHGAIVHYEATPETDVPLLPKGLVLIDSGAQYLDGTTDITRTIALGPLTDEQKRVYTLVAKGHIQLQMLTFPDGASGTQVDAVARQPLWAAGLNYLHGTGHGVGSYLSVHEGPHQIRMEYRPAPLRAGMTVTDEPGVYLSGRFGVRIENTLLVREYTETEFGKFLQFDPLTLCPIDTAPLLTDMLTAAETAWLNAYHQRVYDALSPYLDQEEKTWLQHATAPLRSNN